MKQPPDTKGAPGWALVLIGVLSGLLIVTVIFGLLQRTLDTTAFALALVTALSALATGLVARFFRDSGGDDK